MTNDCLTKDEFVQAHENIKQIEKILDKVQQLYKEIPVEIQDAMRTYHNYDYDIAHCLGWVTKAAAELRANWYIVVAGLPTKEGSVQ